MTLRRIPWDRIASDPPARPRRAGGRRLRGPGPGRPARRRALPVSPVAAPAARARRSPARTRSASSPGSFTPIFQVMFIILVGIYDVLTATSACPAAIGWAIVVLTLLVRIIVIPLYRRQLVSQRRMQLLQPEIKEIQRRYKGDANQGPAGPAGAVQGARRQPARRLPAAPAPDAPAVHHVLGHPERADQPGSPGDAVVLRLQGRHAPVQQRRRRRHRRRPAVHRHRHPGPRQPRSTSASRPPS